MKAITKKLFQPLQQTKKGITANLFLTPHWWTTSYLYGYLDYRNHEWSGDQRQDFAVSVYDDSSCFFILFVFFLYPLSSALFSITAFS